MEHTPSFRFGGRAIIGIGAIVFGGLILLDNMGYLDAGMYLRYWPVILIAVGIAKLFQVSSAGGRFWGFALVLIGGVFLLRTLGVSTIGMRDIWPVLLILLGASLLAGGIGRLKPALHRGATDDLHAYVNCFAMLSGAKQSSISRSFRGGEMTAILGGCEVDLRQADIEGSEAVIDTFAFWGGIEIQVPRHWSVTLQGFPFLGGFEDKTQQPTEPNPKRLIIKGTVIMGGVEITN